ncbi:copper resistance protein CopC [Kineococcus sp. R8]|uniref:copper resistance protein CopC n=1 Tax=Kineococcus siccus TaxID=2696567 RepID=UPI0014135EEC|nr:copper resistance protein CopC [Kineococcus siccus]
MPHRLRRRLPTTALAVLLGAGAGVGAGVAGVTAAAAPAAAHDRLQSTLPADGATLEVAPDRVELVMSSDPLGLGTQVQVTGPAGVVSTGQAQVVDDTVTQALAADRPAGTYEVQWRITSSDGHPVSGSFRFTTTAAGAAPAATPTTTPSPTSTSPAAPAPGAPASSPAVDPVAGTGTSSPLVTAGVLALSVLAIVGVLVGVRRRRGGG